MLGPPAPGSRYGIDECGCPGELQYPGLQETHFARACQDFAQFRKHEGLPEFSQPPYFAHAEQIWVAADFSNARVADILATPCCSLQDCTNW